MNKTFYNTNSFAVISLSLLSLIGCSSDDSSDDPLGNWVDRSVFNGSPRSGISGFSIDNMGYMGVGYDGDDYLNSFWSYDMEGDFWSQKADFPGVARNAAVGFQINGKGYIGSGYDGLDELNDFYAYSPGTNSWDSIAPFPQQGRRSAVAFAINGNGYFGTGFDGDNDLKDFWKYDPTLDSWTEVVGFGGNKRRAATSFTIGEKVYMGTGVSNGQYLDDFWAFDSTTETWSKLSSLIDADDASYNITRSNAVGFELNGNGYIACGEKLGALNTVWEYQPALDFWELKTGFEGATRQDAITFTNGARAFIGLGRTGSLYLDDLDEFFPSNEYDETD